MATIIIEIDMGDFGLRRAEVDYTYEEGLEFIKGEFPEDGQPGSEGCVEEINSVTLLDLPVYGKRFEVTGLVDNDDTRAAIAYAIEEKIRCGEAEDVDGEDYYAERAELAFD